MSALRIFWVFLNPIGKIFSASLSALDKPGLRSCCASVWLSVLWLRVVYVAGSQRDLIEAFNLPVSGPITRRCTWGRWFTTWDWSCRSDSGQCSKALSLKCFCREKCALWQPQWAGRPSVLCVWNAGRDQQHWSFQWIQESSRSSVTKCGSGQWSIRNKGVTSIVVCLRGDLLTGTVGQCCSAVSLDRLGRREDCNWCRNEREFRARVADSRWWGCLLLISPFCGRAWKPCRAFREKGKEEKFFFTSYTSWIPSEPERLCESDKPGKPGLAQLIRVDRPSVLFCSQFRVCETHHCAQTFSIVLKNTYFGWIHTVGPVEHSQRDIRGSSQNRPIRGP